MPWTRKQVKRLLSNGSPLSGDQKEKMKGELHADPQMGHAKKGSAALKRKQPDKRKFQHSSSTYDFREHL